ncbi:MAG: B12-binding domain-containing protein [Methanococcaceae archaeon]
MGNNKTYKDFLVALLSGKRLDCSRAAREYFSRGHDIKDLYENVIKKSLYIIGKLWELNKITVAAEHMAASFTEAILNEFYGEIISDKRLGKKVLAGCVENEFHQIGIKMIGDIFEMNGWDTYFLGANVPADDLVLFAKINRPDIIALSLSIYSNLASLEKMIMKIRAEIPGIIILVGGQAFNHGSHDFLKNYQNTVYLPDLESVDIFIKRMNQNG